MCGVCHLRAEWFSTANVQYFAYCQTYTCFFYKNNKWHKYPKFCYSVITDRMLGLFISLFLGLVISLIIEMRRKEASNYTIGRNLLGKENPREG